MEVVPAMSDASPFQRRDVAEWTHRDRLTGVVETARVETDRWAASSSTAKHAYGKVVDSRNRSLPDGSAHQRQRQQLEVFQTKGPGGSLQVIRTQTVTSTNSSSSWRGGVASTGHRTALPSITRDFEDLQLTLNPLDLSSEKSKASVGRSGSISARRPPSRPRSLVGRVAPTPVTRTCNDTSTTISEAPSKDVCEHSSTTSSKSSTVTLNGHLGISRKKSSSIEDLHNGVPDEERGDGGDDGLKRSSKVRRSLQFPLKKLEARGGVCKLLRELEESSKRNVTEGRIARRSFEALENVLKRNNSLTDSSNLSEREDGESQRDHDEAHSNTESDQYNRHSVNSVSIDDFARKFNSSRSKFILEKRHSLMDTLDKSFLDSEDEKSPVGETKNLSKRHSFVTVESLKEVRGRLKRLNSPLDGLDTESGMEELDDNDDGIGTEESSKLTGSSRTEIPQLRVKSYVYGIEGASRSPRPPVLGTGSLESRTSNKASVNGSRSDEWYNRRKSYGFESVHGDETHTNTSALTSKYDDTNRLTSTDSGICRSSDQFAFPSWKRKQQEPDSANPSETEILQVSHSIPLSKTNKDSTTTTLASNRENVRRGRTTVVTFGSKVQDTYNSNSKEVDMVHRNGDADRTQSVYAAKKTPNSSSEDRGRLSCSQPVTVSIPVLPEESIPSVVTRRLFFQQLSQGSSVSVEKPWNHQVTKNETPSPSLIGSRKVDGDDWWRKSSKHTTGYSANGKVGNEDWQASSKLSNSVMKRHSIAVDSSWKSFGNLNKSVHENLAPPSEDCYRASQNPETESKRHSIAVDKLTYLNDEEGPGYTASYGQQPRDDADNLVSRKQKKVEFCKTEVHFAAEPGRINIVETDEKPPPTNMFRRRRRHSTDAAKNAGNLPEVRFGDSVYEKQLLGGTEELEVVGAVTRPPALPVKVREEVYHTDANCTIESNIVDEDDEHCNYESSSEPTPRSILKNFKKPKPYLIGENEDGYTSIDEQKEEKWGVRLRPVAQEPAAPWRCATGVSARDEVMPTEYSGQSELQKLLRSLRPANSNRAKASILFPQSQKREEKTSECSVAERVRLVEQVASESKGYSTRVNFGAGEATVVDEQQEAVCNQRLYKASDYPKPVWQRREEGVVTRDASKPKVTDHEMQTERTSLSRFLGELPTQQAEVGLHRGGTTTKITIDLSLPPSCHETYQSNSTTSYRHVNGVHKITPRESLLSPSLIMRTIQNPHHPNDTRNYSSPSSSVGSLQEMTQLSGQHSEERVNGFTFQSQLTESRSFGSTKDKEYIPEYKLYPRKQTSQSYQKSWLSGNNGQGSPGRIAKCVENGHAEISFEQTLCQKSSRDSKASTLVVSSGERDSAEEVVVVNQLDAWRALYCDIDSDLSDDSEKADEEVRSFMSVEGDGVSSEVSGSWSRATGLKHLRGPPAREVPTGTSASELPDEVPARLQQRSTATTILPSYTDCDRLRAVDTLVNTRTGHPKITSISLRYGEDNDPVSTRNTDAFKFTSKTSISPDRVNASCNVTTSEDKPTPSTYSKCSYSPQSYPLSAKVAPSHGVSRTRLGASAEKKERRTLFDRADVITTSVAKQSDPPPTTRGLSFSHFDKKPLNSHKSQSPTSKPSTLCQPPTDALTTTEVGTDRSTFAKQLLHSEPTLRNATVSSADKHTTSKVSSSSVSKQSSSHTITTNPQNSSTVVNSKVTSSFERKVSNPSNSIRSPSPRNSSLSYQHVESSEKQTHRSSPRSRGSSESQSGAKLEAITSSRTTSGSQQQRDSKEKTAAAAAQQHPTESNKKPESSPTKVDRLSNDASSTTVGNTVKSSPVGRESRRVTRSTSKSPTPNKKVTPPSKNSRPKDFIGRAGTDSPAYQNGKNSTSPSNTLSTSAKVQTSNVASRSEDQHSQFPVYQNSGMVYDEPLETSNLSNKPEQKRYDSGLDLIETDSAILEELTRAADQILQAVNGYTDEESRRASSDDDNNRRYRDLRSAPLGTIAESPLRKQAELATSSHKTNGRTQRVSSKTKLGPTSSTSSVESFTRETRRALVKTERSSGATTSSRTARMVQRANSRELLLQTNASSSEDIASGTETTKKQRAPPPRRTRTSSSSNKDPSSSSTRSKDRLKDGLDGSRTKERVSSSRGKSRDTSDSRESRRKVPETKHHPIKEKTIPAASGLTGGRERASHARHSTSTRTSKTSNHQEKTTPYKRRSDSAVQT